MRTRYIDVKNWQLLTDSLEPFDGNALKSLESLLAKFDAETEVFTRMMAWNRTHPAQPFLYPKKLIIDVGISARPDVCGVRDLMAVSTLRIREDISSAPGLHIMLRSFAFDIPMEVQIPLRFVLKGMANLAGTYSVFLRGAQGEESLSLRSGRFSVSRTRSLEVAVGDRLLIRANDRRSKLINGEIVTVARINMGVIEATDGRRGGDLELDLMEADGGAAVVEPDRPFAFLRKTLCTVPVNSVLDYYTRCHKPLT